MSILVNHVMSTDQKSKIFDDILSYFIKHSAEDIVHQSSVKPLEGALIRHYHRPQVEKRLITPCVVTVHHDLEESDDWLAIEKFLPRYREANIIICLNTIQKIILASHGLENTVVIPHGYNAKFIRPNVNPPRHWNGKIQLGIISRRYPRKVKGEAYIFELIKRLDPQHFSFILLGNDRLITSAYLNKMGFETLCFENAPYSVLTDVYQIMDVLLMTSRYEGGPANIPEAIGAGVPVYCNPIGMANDLVKDNINGRHLSMNVDRDYISHFKPLIDSDLLFSLKQGAIKRTEEAITWQESITANCNEYQTIIKRIISRFGA